MIRKAAEDVFKAAGSSVEYKVSLKLSAATAAAAAAGNAAARLSALCSCPWAHLRPAAAAGLRCLWHSQHQLQTILLAATSLQCSSVLPPSSFPPGGHHD